jgi:hypothetical protein
VVDGTDGTCSEIRFDHSDDDKEVAMANDTCAQSWAEHVFGRVNLGDARLSKD